VLAYRYKAKSNSKCQGMKIQQQLEKNIVKPSTDLDGNGFVMPVLVILLFPVLRIQNFNLLVEFVDIIHSPMCIVEHMYEYLLEKLFSYKK
jgi:hypothetical protein